MITQEKQIKEAIDARVQATLPIFKPLAYIEQVEKNNFRGAASRFGVRVLTAVQAPGVVHAVTMDYTFELVLTDSYFETNLDEGKKTEATLLLRGRFLDVFKNLYNTKAGLPAQVMNVRDAAMSSPEYLTDAKVVVQRATFIVTARFNLQ